MVLNTASHVSQVLASWLLSMPVEDDCTASDFRDEVVRFPSLVGLIEK